MDADRLARSLLELIRRTSVELPDDVRRTIAAARRQEDAESAAGYAMRIIEDNIALAACNDGPLCQDTGSILFYIHTPVGVDQLLFEDAAIRAVREATARGWLRQNSVDSVTGANSGDNVGPGSPDLHFAQWREPHCEVRLMLKGGGCENVGATYSLPHPRLGGRDLRGVENAILDCVIEAQGQGCGPGVLGVCIGGDRVSGMDWAKRQLLRRLDDQNADPALAELEQRVVHKANQLGIGPMGFGGRTTLLGCKIGKRNRVPASFFVSVSYMCWAFRRQGIALDAAGNIAHWLY